MSDELVFCPVCDSEEFTELGVLGRIHWVRCRHCGADVPLHRVNPDPDYVHESLTQEGSDV